MGTENHDTSRRTILKGSALGAGALIGAAGLHSTARAATPEVIGDGPAEYFLKIDTTSIPLNSFSFATSRGASEGRALGSRTTAGQVHISAPTTKLSPTLLLNSFDGKPLKSATISGNLTGVSDPFVKIELAEVLVSSYQFESDGADIPTESLTLSYGKISFSYSSQDEAGGPVSTTVVKWDVRTAKLF